MHVASHDHEQVMSDASSWTQVVITVAGFSLALYQYYRNSKRDKAIKVADEMDRFFTDENVQFALEIMDYGDARLTSPISQTPLIVSGDLLRRSLAYHEEITGQRAADAEAGSAKEELFTPEERLVRDTFDVFFTRLERIDTLIGNGVIAEDDFGQLFSYWLELMGEWPRDDDTVIHMGNKRRQRLWLYIRNYRFNGVVRLFHRYDRAASVGTPADQAFRRRNPRPSPAQSTTAA